MYILPYCYLPGPASVQHTEVPVHFTCCRWTAASEKAAGALIGDPGSQARWEAYAMIAAIFMWEPLIFGPNIELLIVGDPLGVLDGAGKFRSKDLTTNELCMEPALVFGRRGSAVEAVHIWSADNSLADELSRGSTPAPLPSEAFVSWTNPRWRIATTVKR